MFCSTSSLITAETEARLLIGSSTRARSLLHLGARVSCAAIEAAATPSQILPIALKG